MSTTRLTAEHDAGGWQKMGCGVNADSYEPRVTITLTWDAGDEEQALRALAGAAADMSKQLRAGAKLMKGEGDE